ncbi:MAG: hypothetical protein ACPGJR_01890 [Akkermansiaceae bacterium]
MLDLPIHYAVTFFVVAFFVSVALSRFFIYAGPRMGLMDLPDKRRVHTTPVPRAGGLAVWITFTGMLWGTAALLPELFVGYDMAKLIAWTLSSSVLLLVGLLDDRFGLKPLVKLGGQIVSAGIFCWIFHGNGFPLFGYQLPFWAALVVFLIWCVIIINAFNLIDGLDGLCGGLVVVSLSMILILAWGAGSWADCIFILLMLGAVGGFLVYNVNPARIFLGDTGSMMLGFFIASAVPNIAGERALIGALVLPIAIAGIPLLDVILAIWRRGSRRELEKTQGRASSKGVFSADKDHLHHRLLAMGLTQRKVALILQVVAVFLATICLLPMIIGGRALVVTLFGLVFVTLFGFRFFARIELREAGTLMQVKIRSRTLGLSNRGLHFFYDVCALIGACFLAMTIETNFGHRLEGQHVWSINYLLCFVIIGLILLKVAQTYRRVWSRPTFGDFFIVGVLISMTGLLTSLIWSINAVNVTWADYRAGLLAGQFAIWLILLPRAVPVMLREFEVCADRRASPDQDKSKKRVLIYGAGALGAHLCDFLKVGSTKQIQSFQIVGFLDDHRSLKGRLFRCFPVFGGLDQLPKLSKTEQLDGLVLTISDLSVEQYEKLLGVTKSLDLNLYRWGTGEDISPVSPQLEKRFKNGFDFQILTR